MNSFVLTTVPLFMLMAEILSLSGLSTRIYSGLEKLVARLPGGLLQTNIAGCAIFASVSGSSIATAASIGGVALPQLIRRRYNRALAAGSLAAGGTLGILIPPSFPMIIYGTFTETSVPKLFIAGIIPGLIMTALFMIYIAIHAMIVPVGGAEGGRPALASRGRQRGSGGAAVLRPHSGDGRRPVLRVDHHDGSSCDRLCAVDPARRHARHADVARSRAGDAQHDLLFRQHPVSDLRRLHLLGGAELRRDRRDGHGVRRRPQPQQARSSTSRCSCCSQSWGA